MFIGRKVNSRAKQTRKGASLPNRVGHPTLKGKAKANLATGQSNIHMYKVPNPSFNYKNRNRIFEASNETPMEVYLRSVEGAAMARISDANERRFKKPQTSAQQYRSRLGHAEHLQEYQMQTLPDYPVSMQHTVRRDTAGNVISTAPDALNTNDSTLRTRLSNQQQAIANARQRASHLEKERSRSRESPCGDCTGEDNGKLAMERQYDKLRKETLTAADLLRTGYSNNRGQADDQKFKIYGKNLAAQEFNSIVKEK